jgi:hypothetical protein
LIVELEAPGFDEKELSLEVSDHTLTIKGERAKEKEEREKTFYLHERIEKHFERQFKLPPEADVEHVKATLAPVSSRCASSSSRKRTRDQKTSSERQHAGPGDRTVVNSGPRRRSSLAGG